MLRLLKRSAISGILCLTWGAQVYAEAPAAPKPCAYEVHCDCASPGHPERWQASYCMAKSETDDFESDVVQACLTALEPEVKKIESRSACSQNLYWHEKLCSLKHSKDSPAWKRCLKVIPPFIASGA